MLVCIQQEKQSKIEINELEEIEMANIKDSKNWGLSWKALEEEYGISNAID